MVSTGFSAVEGGSLRDESDGVGFRSARAMPCAPRLLISGRQKSKTALALGDFEARWRVGPRMTCVAAEFIAPCRRPDSPNQAHDPLPRAIETDSWQS